MGSPDPAVCYRENWFPIVRDLFSFRLVPSSSSRTVGGLVARHPAGWVSSGLKPVLEAAGLPLLRAVALHF